MKEKDQIHIRISKEMNSKIESLIEKGLYSNKNELIRSVIRDMLLKYKIL